MTQPKTIDELRDRLSNIDSEALLFFHKYLQHRETSTSIFFMITSVLASAAGAAIAMGSFFPKWEVIYVLLAASFVAIILGVYAFKFRKKRELDLIKEIMSNLETQEMDSKKRKDLISEILKDKESS